MFLVNSLSMALSGFSNGVNWHGFLTINLGYERPYNSCGSVPGKFFSNTLKCFITGSKHHDVVHLASCMPNPVLSRHVNQAYFENGANYRVVSVITRAIKRIDVYAHCGVRAERLDFLAIIRKAV